jgi:DNA-binding transcriptional ArsR family regulator
LKYPEGYLDFVPRKKKRAPKKKKPSRKMVLPQEVRDGLAQMGGYKELLAAVPKTLILQSIAQYHHAMSDPIRLRILWSLSVSELCPCVLKKVAQVSDSKLSYHLRLLEKAELISSRRSKNWRIYSVTEDGLAALGKL